MFLPGGEAQSYVYLCPPLDNIEIDARKYGAQRYVWTPADVYTAGVEYQESRANSILAVNSAIMELALYALICAALLPL